jgi:DNA-binding MarR family transcriptional regulator
MQRDVSRKSLTVGLVDPAPWLTDEEQHLWRRWLLVQNRLATVLNDRLQTDSGLSLQDFDVLTRLTDDATGKIRITQLATGLDWERSRLSHHIRRMQKRGLVEREECPDDGRGAFVVLTKAGRAAIEHAAPGHVRTVRRIVFDSLSADELKMLDIINRKVLHQLET